MRRFFAFLKKVSFHPNPKTRFLITLVYCGIGIWANFFLLQVFCMPVMYARVMCIAFFITILIFPFVKTLWLKTVLYFLLGMGVPICVYCILFLGGGFNPLATITIYLFYILTIIFLGAGLLALIPFYLLRQIYFYYKNADFRGKQFFKAGMFLPIIILAVYLIIFRFFLSKAIDIQIKCATTDEFVDSLPKNYFTERILGLCWKYHTRIDLCDGWRPPLHDPFLVISLWVNPTPFFHNYNEPDLWPVYNSEAIKYYHRKFPERRLKESCPCSYSNDGKEYLSDPLDSTVSVRH